MYVGTFFKSWSSIILLTSFRISDSHTLQFITDTIYKHTHINNNYKWVLIKQHLSLHKCVFSKWHSHYIEVKSQEEVHTIITLNYDYKIFKSFEILNLKRVA